MPTMRSRASAEETPDAVPLDLNVPGLPGTEILRQLQSNPPHRRGAGNKAHRARRRAGPHSGIRGSEPDDYITTFSVREVVLRVKAVLRRGAPGESPARDRVGPLRLDREAPPRLRRRRGVELTALEFKLLETFVARLGRVQTREQLLRDRWWEMKTWTSADQRTVDTHVKRLREKLGAGRNLIETVRGLGYRMSDPAEG